MKICKNCEKEFQPKNKRAIFCKDSCRVSFHQQQKRLSEKKPVKKIIKSIHEYLSKSAAWTFVSLFAIFIILQILPNSYRFFETYRKYEIGQQNKELEELKQTLSTIKNPEMEYHVLKEKYDNAVHWLNVLLDSKNGWMTKKVIEEFKKGKPHRKKSLKEIDVN